MMSSVGISATFGILIKDHVTESSLNYSTTLASLEATDYSLEITRLVVSKFGIPFIVCIGVCCNTLNFVILRHPKMRTSTNVYLTALAVVDSLFLIISLALSFVHYSNPHLASFAYYYIPFGRTLTDVFGNTAVWLTVVFTMERYVGVRFPMKGKVWCTIQKAKIATACTFLCCLVNTLPEFFETKVIANTTTRDNDTNTIYTPEYTAFADRDSYLIGYYWWYMASFCFLPLLLLLVFNSLLIRSVWNANIRRKSLSQSVVTGHDRHSMEQQRITIMLIAVVIVFLFCQLPWTVLLLYKTYLSSCDMHVPMTAVRIAGNICNLLVVINASINFVLYSCFSCKFRRTLEEVVCRISPRSPNKVRSPSRTVTVCSKPAAGNKSSWETKALTKNATHV